MSDDPFHPRKQPKQARSRFVFDAIVSAAGRVLPGLGLERLTTHHVADAAGVSIGSLYQYFPTKEAVIGTLVEKLAHDDVARAREVIAADRPVRDQIAHLSSAMVDAHRRARSLYRAVLPIVSRVRRHREVRELAAGVRDQIREALERRRDELRKDDLDLAVFVAGHAFEACLHAALEERPDLLDDPRFAAELADLVSRYLARDPD